MICNVIHATAYGIWFQWQCKYFIQHYKGNNVQNFIHCCLYRVCKVGYDIWNYPRFTCNILIHKSLFWPPNTTEDLMTSPFKHADLRHNHLRKKSQNRKKTTHLRKKQQTTSHLGYSIWDLFVIVYIKIIIYDQSFYTFHC